MIQDLDYWKKRAWLAEELITKLTLDHKINLAVSQSAEFYRWENFVVPGKKKDLVLMYEILHASIKERECKREGICNNINRLFDTGVFNDEERFELLSHFLCQRPSMVLHKEYFEFTQSSGFWWSQDAFGFEKRKMFLTKIIYQLKNG